MVNGLMVKVCGMRFPDNIRRVEELGFVDILGFIFYDKSPRYVGSLPEYIPKSCKKAGVFVNEDIDTILDIYQKFELDYVQLHGSESPEYCAVLAGKGIKVIKSFLIESAGDLDDTLHYEGSCSNFLFDTKSVLYGGSGKEFDWSVLEHYGGDTRFFISGGIGLDNMERLKEFRHCKWAGIDLNSKFEMAPGRKDIDRLQYFFKNLSNNTITL